MNLDPEIIGEFIQESREHLDSIEIDLLTIEGAGQDADPELVNKVFRAAHSIKGGAGFLELRKIQELAHKTESILDLVRNKEIQPSAEVINILLQAFDRLKELIADYGHSNEADITDIAVALTGLLSSFLEGPQKQQLSEKVEIRAGPGADAWRIEVNRFDLGQAHRSGQYVYLVEVDLLRDIEQRGLRPWDFIQEINSAGNLLGCEVNLAAVGTLDDDPSEGLTLELLYATILEPAFIDGLFEGVDPTKIQLIQDPNADPYQAGTSAQRSSLAARADDAPSTLTAPGAGSGDSVPATTPPPFPKEAVRQMRRAEAKEESAETEPAARIEETLRVNVSLLDKLMNLAGELVLGRNQLDEAIQHNDRRLVQSCGQRISLITSELQDAILQTRMQPIGNILNKFTRVVRDLANKSGKRIQVEIKGKEVELDKAIVEGIGDPLTHMIRNAVDHGIESPETRRQSGKPEIGLIFINAYHAAGQVVIEIADDGAGMDARKIGASAVRKGRISEDELSRLSDQEMLQLIFLPGLSTAEQVTDISGRGVGMDVVKTNIDRLGGRIEIETDPGNGSMFRVFLPLTLAIMPSLLVSLGRQKFAIAQANVRELLRLTSTEARQRIQMVGDCRALLLRDQLIPLVDLYSTLGMADNPGMMSRDLQIVVVQSGKLDYGLVVDCLHDTMEIVVRPLGAHIRDCVEYAGATILGNGEVAMILDVSSIAQKSGLRSLSESDEAKQLASEASVDLQAASQLLVFHNSPQEACAVPLEAVMRIEDIQATQIETVGGLRAMQYGKRQLPLITLSDFARVEPLPERDQYKVLVIATGKQELGLIGCDPLDIVQEVVEVDTSHAQPGIVGSTILHGQTTLLVNASHLGKVRRPLALQDESRRESEEESPHSRGSTGDGPTLLLAEDSAFFRTHIIDFLHELGYRVLAAENGAAAYRLLLDHAEEVSLVLTDVEMPEMDGLSLTRKIRESPRLQHLPVIAITTLADESDIQRGRDAGVTDYQIKLDKESLAQAIQKHL